MIYGSLDETATPSTSLLIDNSYISIEIRAWISNCILKIEPDVITHPCSDFNGGFAEILSML